MKKKYPDKIKNLPEFAIWSSMKARCHSPSNNIGNYKLHKIAVCDEWKNDFFKFYLDMGDRPSDKHSLDRIDNLNGYSKENCRWTTKDIQNRNKNNNKYFTYMGKTLTLTDWAKKLNLNYKMLHLRITRYKLSFEEAIKEDPFKKLIEINGEKMKLTEWCKKYNREFKTVMSRISSGWEKEKAILTPTKNNNDYKSRNLSQEDKNEALKMLAEKKSLSSIAKKFNVSTSAIHYLKLRNIKLEK